MSIIAHPCPSWCQLPPGHDQADPGARDSDGSLYVRHRALLADAAGQHIEIEQLVVVGGPDQGAEPPVVMVDGERPYTRAEADQLADGFALASRFLASVEA